MALPDPDHYPETLSIDYSWRTSDDSFGRKLNIVVNNATSFQVSGADYDALGQWSDETIKGLILARYGLELA